MVINGDLRQLVHEVWAEYAAFQDMNCLVDNSIPILYFGDLEAYQRSELRVITAALNPSNAEFPEGNAFLRFPTAEKFPEISEAQYLCGLGAYFKNRPYWRWFGSLEPVLRGVGASFRPGCGYTALHTDLCTPIATDPTWSRLPENVRSRLVKTGQPIWHRLVEYLQPDVILLSVAKRHLDAVRFERQQTPKTFFTVPQVKPFVATITPLRLSSQKVTHLVFGPAARTPFGLISYADRQTLGEKVLSEVRGG